MNLSQVEYFLAVADKLNFTVAAQALYISQPALSKQITMLEKELGTKLFVRDNRKVKLTNAGIKLKEDLQDIVIAIENAKQNAMKIGSEEKGVFRIGCFDGIVVNDYLPKVLQKIETRFPETKVIMKRSNFKEVREALENNEVDIIFTMDFELPELYSFHTKKVKSRESAFIYSSKLPLANKENISIKDFEEIPLLICSPEVSEGGYRSTLEVMNKLGLNNLNINKIDNFTTLLTYLEMGYGFALLAEEVVNTKYGLKKFSINEKELQKSIIAAWTYENPIISFLMDSLEL